MGANQAACRRNYLAVALSVALVLALSAVTRADDNNRSSQSSLAPAAGSVAAIPSAGRLTLQQLRTTQQNELKQLRDDLRFKAEEHGAHVDAPKRGSIDQSK